MKYILFIFFNLVIINSSFSQENSKFCAAVEKENFQKAERLFKKQIQKRKHGTQYEKGPGSSIQTTHVYNLDTLTMWLKGLSCVEDAAWDKCQDKIAIYPGWSTIGVIFKTQNGKIEKCFFIQEGTTGTIRFFGLKFHLFKTRNILVYKKMYDCDGFVNQQKVNCRV